MNYTNAAVHSSVDIDNITYPFSVYAELFTEEDDELDFTGNCHVVAITPQGTRTFTVYNDGEFMDESDAVVVNELLPPAYKEAVMKVVEVLQPH